MAILTSTYEPPVGWGGGHRQTLWASVGRSVLNPYTEAASISTPDGEVLEAAWVRDANTASWPPLAILSHGLEGNIHRAYMRGMARTLHSDGWDVLAWNLRGCGTAPPRTPTTYHSGKTDDLDCVVQHALHAGYDTLALVGFSLGGNLTLKYMGERGTNVDARIQRAVAFSTPVDLAPSAHQIGHWTNIHYTYYFLRKLRRTVRRKARHHPEAISTAPLRKVRTLVEFDDAYTASLNGFRNAAHYYAEASSKPHLTHIARPTLLVNAANDPFLPASCYPYTEAHAHPHFHLEVPLSGGHVGFVTASASGAYWSELRAAAFLRAAT